MKNKIFKLIYSTCKYIVTVFFAIAMLWLFFMSMVSTTYITIDASEKSYYVKDSVILNMVYVLVSIELVYLIYRIRYVRAFFKMLNENEVLYKRVKKILTIVILAMGIFWVLTTQCGMGRDQAYVMQAAKQLRWGDYSMFEKQGYIHMYPNQLGMVFIVYILSCIFGSMNVLVIRMINVFCLCAILNILEKTGRRFGLGRAGSVAIMLLGILFLPLTFYTSFVYGTMMGLTAGLAAMDFIFSYVETGKIKYAISGGIFIGLAVVCKSNYLIFLVAILLFSIFELFRRRNVRILIGIAAVIVCYVVLNAIPKVYIEHKTGCDMSDGANTYAWIAMGLSDSSSHAEGWFNFYVEGSYEDSNYSGEKQKSAAKEKVSTEIKNWLSHPSKARTFIADKTASQWNNPTFQSLWISQISQGDIEKGGITGFVLSLSGSNKIAGYLNILQVLILAGAVLSLFSVRKKDGGFMIMYYMTFVGGFVFHMFWEAKAQYTFPYFVMLLPLTVAGYKNVARRLLHLRRFAVEIRKQSQDGVRIGEQLKVWALANEMKLYVNAFIIILIIGCLFIKPIRTLAVPKDMTNSYKEYTDKRMITKVLSDDEYYIAPYSDQSVFLNVIDYTNGSAKVLFGSTGFKVGTRYINTYTKIKFNVSELYLHVKETSSDSSYTVDAEKTSDNTPTDWQIQKTSDGSYYILYNKDYALTFNSDYTISVTKFTGDDNQKWMFTSAKEN